MLKFLTAKRSQGFGAKVNVVNYNGQTPLLASVKEGNFDAAKLLIEAGAKVDLNGGELVKIEE